MIIKQKLVERTDNHPSREFPGGFADYITVHMTGNRNAGADARAHAEWMFNHAPYSWHATVDDREVWQSILWHMQGWHAGDGPGDGNVESIGIEICMNKGIDQEAAYALAAELVRVLLAAGHGSAGVVQHNFWTGKDCPELIRAEAGRWERFLWQVEGEGEGMDENDRKILMAAAEGTAQLQQQIFGAPGKVAGYVEDPDGSLITLESLHKRITMIEAGGSPAALPDHQHGGVVR